MSTTLEAHATDDRWGDPGVHIEDDYSIWPKTMNRLSAILESEKLGEILEVEPDAAIDELYAEVCDGLNSIGCGYFWGYVDAYRGR